MKGADVQMVALLGVLALGGVVAYREFDQRRDVRATTGAAVGQIGTSTGATGGGSLGGLLPAGSTAPVGGSAGDLAAILAEQQRQAQAQADALLRQQRIDTLRRDLARIQNEIDVQVVRAQSIKSRPVDAGFAQDVRERVWNECKSKHVLFPTTQCLNAGTREKAEAAVQPAWDAKIALELQPIQAELSRLNSDQLATVDNLRQLGVAVPAAQMKKVTL